MVPLLVSYYILYRLKLYLISKNSLSDITNLGYELVKQNDDDKNVANYTLRFKIQNGLFPVGPNQRMIVTGITTTQFHTIGGKP